MVILITGIVLILYCLLSKGKYSPYIGFLFVLLVMGFQSNVQGDYYAYLDQFQTLDIRTLENEPLWGLFLKLFQWSSYPIFIFAISLMQYVVLVKSAVSYSSNSKFDILTPVLFFFTFYMMLMQMKAIRQGIAVDLCALSMLLLFMGKKWWLSFLPVVTAYFIHNSTLMFVPAVVLYYLWIKKQDSLEDTGEVKVSVLSHFFLKRAIITVAVYLMVYLYKSSVLNMMQSTVLNIEGFRLAGYMNDIELTEISYLFVVYNAVVIFFSVLACEIMSPKMRFFVVLSVIGSFLETLFFGIGSLFRLTMFFAVYNIFILPYAAKYIRLRYGRILSIVFIVFLMGYAFKMSLPWLLATSGDRFGDFKFIFMD